MAQKAGTYQVDSAIDLFEVEAICLDGEKNRRCHVLFGEGLVHWCH